VLRFTAAALTAIEPSAKPETSLCESSSRLRWLGVPVGISAIAPGGVPAEDPTPRSIFSAAEDSLRRRVTRSKPFLPNPASPCQASLHVFSWPATMIPCIRAAERQSGMHLCSLLPCYPATHLGCRATGFCASGDPWLYCRLSTTCGGRAAHLDLRAHLLQANSKRFNLFLLVRVNRFLFC